MDVLTENPGLFQDISIDTDLGLDNDALMFEDFDLEKYITDDVCVPEEAISAIAYNHPNPNPNGSNGFRINNVHLRGLQTPVQQQQQQTAISQGQGHLVQPSHSNSIYCGQQQQQQQRNNMAFMDNHHIMHTTLPDSPPDSEPYSPPDGHPSNGHSNGGQHQNGGHMNSNHPSNGHQNAGMSNGVHPNNTHQDPKYTLSSTPSTMHSHMYPPHHRPPGIGQSQPKTIITMPGYHENPILNHLPPSSLQQATPLPPVTMPLNLPPHQGMNPQMLTAGNLSPQNKKRKHMESPNSSGMFPGRNGLVPHIKQEPAAFTNQSYLPDCDDDYSDYNPDSSNGFDNGVYQVIKWQPYQMNKWATLTDSNLKDLPAPQYRVDADKGFNFSVSDDAFVCQKKNHFQITCHTGISGDPKYVRTSEGVKKIDHYCLHFHGVKMESQNQTIRIEQSQSDRSKKAFKPVRLDILPDQVSKMTVGRLHFSETTSNNMRKKGRPNPDQRYFMLVIALHAHSGESSYMIAASISERLIVRASNPGQFDSDIDVQHWQKGQSQDSVYHIGRVGVNTDHPDEALTVHGNVKLSGQVLHTSDVRAKHDLKEVDSKEQLKKVAGMKIYDYKYSEDYAEHVGLPEDRRKDTGVIAQEIRELLPDAVLETGDVHFQSGGQIKNLLVVNKDRIFMENVGAVKELCKLTDNLEVRIDELEKMNTKLSKLKRFDSFKSTISSKSSCSNSTVNSAPPKKSHRYHHPKSRSQPTPTPPAPSNNGWCSNRFIQVTIIILICIMAFCLIAITTLYILERINNNFGDNNNSDSLSDAAPNISHTPTQVPNPHRQTSPSTMVTRAPLPTIIIPDTSPTGSSGNPATVPPKCAMSDCEELCCGPASDEGTYDPTGYQEFLHDMRVSKKGMIPSYTIQNGPTTRQPPYTTPKIQVIINPNGPYSDNDSFKPLVPYNTYTGSHYKRRRRSVSLDIEFPAEVSIAEVNFTVSGQFLKGASSDNNNLTYEMPFSKYFDYSDYTLQFNVSQDHVVHMCHHGVSQFCDGISAEDNWAEISVNNEWKIPFGKYKSSFFRFRVTALSHEAGVCTMPGSESAGSFTEYNLYFARQCI